MKLLALHYSFSHIPYPRHAYTMVMKELVNSLFSIAALSSAVLMIFISGV